jgi:hypothetical protein
MHAAVCHFMMIAALRYQSGNTYSCAELYGSSLNCLRLSLLCELVVAVSGVLS